MPSDTTTQMDHNESRLVNTEAVDMNSTRPLERPHCQDDLWDNESNPHLERIVSRCEDELQFSHKLVTKQKQVNKLSLINQVSSREINMGDFIRQNTRYSALDSHIYKKPASASHLDTLSPSTDVGNTRALTCLIIMCNDRVRKSFFKHGVLGVPLGKKPSLDKVNGSTLIFLFEFEARALWGIYQASSEVGIDIEKDAYRGSETAFPAQVKFRIYKKCRPLPEKLFKLAIADNYYCPTKFSFELTDKQVTFLTRLYHVRDAEKLKIDSRVLSIKEPGIPYEVAGKTFSQGTVYQTNGVRTNGRNAPNITRNPTNCKLSRGKELLMRGSDSHELTTITPDQNLASCAEHDTHRYLFRHHKDLPFSSTHKGYSHVLSNQEFECSIDDEQNGGCMHVTDAALLEPRTTSMYYYPLVENILSEDDLRRQLYQSKHFHYAGKPAYESLEEDMSACSQSPPANFLDAVKDSQVKTEQPLDEEHYLRVLKSEYLNSSIHSRLLPSRRAQHDASAYQRLSRGQSPCDVALWNVHLQSKERSQSCLTTSSPMHAYGNHCMEIAPASDLQALQRQTTLQGAGNDYTSQAPTKRHLISPGEACAQTHDYAINGFSTRGNAQNHPCSVDGFSAGGKACPCERRRAPPEEEAWHDELCRKRLKSKSTQGIEVGNNMCTARCCVSKAETGHSEDEPWLASILDEVKHCIQKRHGICGDNGAWIGADGLGTVNHGCIASKHCNNEHDVIQNEEDDRPVQADQTGGSELQSQQQNPSLCADVVGSKSKCEKPARKSVWSRLSATRSTLKSRQISNSNEDDDMGELKLVFSEALPWKEGEETGCEDLAEYGEEGYEELEEDGEDLPDGECYAVVGEEVDVRFKRRKLGAARTGEEDAPSNAQAEEHDPTTTTDPCSNSRQKRRKIRRPL